MSIEKQFLIEISSYTHAPKGAKKLRKLLVFQGA